MIAMASNVAAARATAPAEYRVASALVEAQFGAFDLARARPQPGRAGGGAEAERSTRSTGWLALMLGFSDPGGRRQGRPRRARLLRDQGRLRPALTTTPPELAAAPSEVLAKQADRLLVVCFPLRLRGRRCRPAMP